MYGFVNSGMQSLLSYLYETAAQLVHKTCKDISTSWILYSLALRQVTVTAGKFTYRITARTSSTVL